MSFREKSAWLMGTIMVLGAVYYFNLVNGASRAMGDVSAPVIGFVIAYVVVIVLASIVGMILLGISSPAEANAPADEREKMAEYKAGHWSGIVLGIGVVSSLLNYAVTGNGNMLFHLCFGSLMVSQIAEYGLQIILFRRGV